jgi:hypothetical protein
MADPHALTLDIGGQRLSFRCTYDTLLRLDALGDWRAMLADAMSFQKVSALVEITALFTGRTPAEIIALSPPVADCMRCITGAWAMCMEGPEGLRRHQEAVAKEAAAPDAGKPRPGLNGSAASFWTRITKPLSRAWTSLRSGA